MTGAQRGGILFRLLSLIFLAALFFMLYLVRHPLLRLAGGWWVVSDPLQHADAMIVLGDDTFSGDRAARAAELFQAGWAPQGVASGRMLRPYAGVAELIRTDLEGRGVPAAAIVPFAHRAENTLAEAEALRDLVAQRQWHRILVVTSNYHTRRARYIFRKVFPSDVLVLIESARDTDFDPDGWWESRSGLKLFFTESVAYTYAIWELRQTRSSARAPSSTIGRESGANTRATDAASAFQASSASHVQLFSVYNLRTVYYIPCPSSIGRAPLGARLPTLEVKRAFGRSIPT